MCFCVDRSAASAGLGLYNLDDLVFGKCIKVLRGESKDLDRVISDVSVCVCVEEIERERKQNAYLFFCSAFD